MLFANGSKFSNIVDKADISFGCSVAFTDLNVPKSMQEFRPRVGPHPVPESQPDFVIPVIVPLKESEGQVRAR